MSLTNMTKTVLIGTLISAGGVAVGVGAAQATVSPAQQSVPGGSSTTTISVEEGTDRPASIPDGAVSLDKTVLPADTDSEDAQPK